MLILKPIWLGHGATKLLDLLKWFIEEAWKPSRIWEIWETSLLKWVRSFSFSFLLFKVTLPLLLLWFAFLGRFTMFTSSKQSKWMWIILTPWSTAIFMEFNTPLAFVVMGFRYSFILQVAYLIVSLFISLNQAPKFQAPYIARFTSMFMRMLLYFQVCWFWFWFTSFFMLFGVSLF